MLCLAGCGGKSDLKAELENVRISGELPRVSVAGCRYLADADEAVYEQQIAACELYYEAYELTRTSDYIENYEDNVKKERIAYYCNERRKELNLEISTQLHDNVREIISSAEDCSGVDAYLDRVDYDTLNFYDYYAEYLNSDDTEEALCKILKVFYERSNILAFTFMSKHEDEIVEAAVNRIVENSRANSEYNVYVLDNSELIKALNMVYGGVEKEYTDVVSEANIALIRRMLEDDSDLNDESINNLMSQLGEPTPAPEPTPTPTPEETEEPVEIPTVTVPPAYMTEKPTPVPTQRPQTPTPQTPKPQVSESYEF